MRNFVGNPSQPYPHNVGPGLGTADHNGDRESLLDKIRNVTPLRASGLDMLEGRTVCAVVFDSNISVNYGPLNGSLKGENLGTVAMRVLDVTKCRSTWPPREPDALVLIDSLVPNVEGSTFNL